MKTSAIVGIVLVVLGILALAYGGITYTREKTVIDLGPIEARAETRETIPLPPVLGAAAVVGGIVLLARKPRRA